MALFEGNNLTLGYENTVVAEGISFQVEKGNYLCIIGANGSGKTTLIKSLLSLQKPLKGTIQFEGSPKRIGYMPQQTKIMTDFPASVEEIVLSGCRLDRFPWFHTKKSRKKAEEIMELLDISDLSANSFRQLSGGQQQRVLLARALCAAEEILILDEPAAALDPRATEDLYKQIRHLNQSGMTIIMVTHDIPAALQYSSHILAFGSPVFFGTTDAYKERSLNHAR